MSEQDQVFSKCAWRLIPFMVLLYLINYIDRVNVGLAALTMNKDLGFTPAIYGFGAGVLFFSYALFQVPANLILSRLGARRWIFCILAAWGALSGATAFVQGPTSFYVLRFLLGLAEAGFFPGMIFYLTLWFPQSYRARFIASFYAAVPFSFIIGGPLSSVVLGMEGVARLHGWQWLFLVEGLPACILAFTVLKLLPDGPMSASWLTPEEKGSIAKRMASDDVSEHGNPWLALRDPRVVALGLINFGSTFGEYGIQLWLPQFVHAMGYSNYATGFLVPLPFAVSIIVLILWGRYSDGKRDRFWCVALPLLLAGGGFAVASVSQYNPVALLALSCAVIGTIAVSAPFWSLPSSFLRGPAAAASIALVRTIGGLGGFSGSFVVGLLKQEFGGYPVPWAVLACSAILTAIGVLGLGRAMTPRPTVVQPAI